MNSLDDIILGAGDKPTLTVREGLRLVQAPPYLVAYLGREGIVRIYSSQGISVIDTESGQWVYSHGSGQWVNGRTRQRITPSWDKSERYSERNNRSLAPVGWP